MKSRQSRWIAGLILIAVGLGFFFLRGDGVSGTQTVAVVISAVFLVAYLLRRSYGLLVPAGILLGLGFGDLLEFGSIDDGTTFGLGCGFVFIYLVALLVERSSHWWPLIPGVVLILGSFDNLRQIGSLLYEYWPLALVAVGLLIIFGFLGGDRDRGG